MALDPVLRVLEDAERLAAAAAETFAERAREAVAARGRFVAALAGGATPRRLYEVLATGAHAVPWERTWLVTGDERAVPPDDPESNYGMIRASLLVKVGVPPERVLRFETEDAPPDDAARGLEARLRALAAPLDLALLGLGADGHTASLFPGSPALDESARLAVAHRVESLGVSRLTLTLPALNAAREAVFLVSGRAKAEVVRRVLARDPALPASRIRPASGRLTFLLDRDAASRLP